MEATEFPAMVLLLVDKSDISPDCGGESENGFDHVVFHAESRWLARDWWTALWWRQSERKMLKRARRLDQTGANLQMGQRSITSPNLFQEPMRELEYMTLRRRRGALAASGLGSTIVTQLPKFPPPNEPTIDGVVLSAGKTVTSQHFYGWKNAVSVFVVKGNNFSDETVKGATVGSRDCAVKVIGSKTVVVTCDAWGDKTETEAVPQSGEPEPYDKTKYEGKPSIAELVLITTYGPKKVGKVQFDYKYGASRTNARPSVAIERDKDGNITRVKVTGEFEDAEKLLKLIQDALLCCDEHAHHVCGVCGCVYHKGGDCCCKSSRSGRAKVPG